MSLRYLVITPVKDEDRFAEHTLRSMSRQTLPPVRWIVVDDGSTDGTPQLLEKYKEACPFLQVITRPQGEKRQPGGAVVQAFNHGLAAATDVEFDFVVKLDCDLSFEKDYFERLLREFEKDPLLGIASGVYVEDRGAGWKEVIMPSYHASGASKVVRKKCFQDIGGFQPTRGWDTIDEIKAMNRGWRTTHFPKLKMHHWKPEGSGIGTNRTAVMHGEIYYLTGGSKLFFLLKVLYRMRRRPFVTGGCYMAWGYIRTALSRKTRLVTHDEARSYRALLNERIYRGVRRWFQADRSNA